MLNAEPIMGGTSPVTAAGALSLANAEILAGIVLVQLLEPGRPVVHNLGFAHAIDMRTGTCLAGSAECALLSHSGGRIAAYYGIPCASWMGTDAMIDDEQASMEKLLTAFAHVTSDVSLIWGMGQLESEKSISPVQLLIDHELASAALRYHRGFEVSEETLAYRVIEEVVTRGGDFLSHEHTLEHFREELSESKLLVRTNRDRWTAAGAKELAQSAAEKLDALRNSERPAHLSDDQQRELERIEKTVFRRESGSKH
jgi:trimethylamine--corrinoid protein Co-methyltransferase